MVTFEKTMKAIAQGDVYFRRASIPASVKSVESTGEDIVVAHSETGHHHVMVLDRDEVTNSPQVELFTSEYNPLITWLKVNRPTMLEHRRSFDTHEPVMFPPGEYEIRHQKEYTPEGWRKVVD